MKFRCLKYDVEEIVCAPDTGSAWRLVIRVCKDLMLASISFCRYTPVRTTRCQQERAAISACVSFGIAVFIINSMKQGPS
jgi:hypothetical protein